MAIPVGIGYVSDLEMRHNPTSVFVPEVDVSRWIRRVANEAPGAWVFKGSKLGQKEIPPMVRIFRAYPLALPSSPAHG